MNKMFRCFLLVTAVFLCLWAPAFADTTTPTPSATTTPGSSPGVDVNAEDFNGLTPLMRMVADGKADNVKAMIAAGANVNAANATGDTPLLYAAALEQLDIAKLLLDKGADVNARNATGWTPLLIASLHGNTAMCLLLVNSGADINAATVKAPPTQSLIDVNAGTMEDGIRQSIADWCEANAKARNKAMWLSVADVAMTLGQNELARSAGPPTGVMSRYSKPHIYTPDVIKPKAVSLKVQGAQDETSDTDSFDATLGRTPVHNAVISGNIETVKLLIDRGAKLDIADEDGVTPLQLAMEYDRDEIGSLIAAKGTVPLTMTQAIRCGSDNDVMRLLAAGADLKAHDEFGDTPLHTAAKYGRIALVTALIEKGADVDALNSLGLQTPLCSASAKGQTEAVRLLLSKGAQLTVKGASDYSPLHAAARRGYTETVQLLLANKADVDASCNLSGTPLEEAIRGGHADTVKALLANNATVEGEVSPTAYPPIFEAAMQGNVEIVTMLLDAGADYGPRYKKLFGMKMLLYQTRTPLALAASYGHLDTANLLLSRGAAPQGIALKAGPYRVSHFHRCMPRLRTVMRTLSRCYSAKVLTVI